MKKGIGPRGLGAPKSAAKMYGKSPAKKMTDPPTKQDYYNLRPKDARTYADSVAVETAHFSESGRIMGEAAGKIASGGGIKNGQIVAGNTPNSPKAKQMLKEMRALGAKHGKNYKDVYK